MPPYIFTGWYEREFVNLALTGLHFFDLRTNRREYYNCRRDAYRCLRDGRFHNGILMQYKGPGIFERPTLLQQRLDASPSLLPGNPLSRRISR